MNVENLFFLSSNQADANKDTVFLSIQLAD